MKYNYITCYKRYPIKGVVKVDNSSLIDNYLKLMEGFSLGDNPHEVMSYALKILDLDPENYIAWIYRARADLWSSLPLNLKFDSSLELFKKAIALAPENKKIELSQSFSKDISDVFNLLLEITLYLPLVTSSSLIHNLMNSTLMALDGVPYLDVELIDNLINEIEENCSKSKKGFHPKDRILYVVYSGENGNVNYGVTFRNKLESKLNAEKEKQANMIEDYWVQHKEEKNKLYNEKQELLDKIKFLNNDIEQKQKPINDIISELALMHQQYNKIGFFKAKEKEELKSQIDSLLLSRSTLEKSILPTIDMLKQEQANCEKQVLEIEQKITKPI